MTKALDEIKTYYQLHEYAEDEFRMARNKEQRLYWEGVKDGLRKCYVVLNPSLSKTSKEVALSSKYREIVDDVVGKSLI